MNSSKEVPESSAAGSELPAGTSLLAGARPLFLIGSPRSGTTLLAKILNSHPRVLITNETAVFLQLDENIRKSRRGWGWGVIFPLR